MTAQALPQQWTAADLDGLSEREKQLFFWGVSVGYRECAETRDTAVIFNAGYLAASQRQIDMLTPKPDKALRPRRLSAVPS